MANVAPGIITMGLGGSATNMIIGFPFNLGFVAIEVGSPIIPPVVPPTIPNRGRHGAGGGVRPYEDDDVWPDQTEREEELFKTVTIRIKLGDKTTEKMYLVKKHRADQIVEVMKMTNNTRKRIKIAVGKMKSKASQIVTKVTNIRKKRK